MIRILFNLLPVIFLWLGSCCVVMAQAPVAQSDQITTDGEITQDDDSSSGKFQSVDVDALTTSDVTLQFPASLTNRSVSGTIDQNGALTFSFQVSDQPGVHRVIVIDPNADEDSLYVIGMVQFEVPPAAN